MSSPEFKLFFLWKGCKKRSHPDHFSSCSMTAALLSAHATILLILFVLVTRGNSLSTIVHKQDSA